MISIGNHEYVYQTTQYNANTDKDPSGLHNGYHPIWGNYENDSNGECGVPTIKRFKMPSNGNTIFWYSYNLGFIHFIVISSEHDSTVDSIQYLWLQNDLQSVDRSLTPWIILQCHRPIYHAEIYTIENNVSNHLNDNLEELLHTHEVDFHIAGHWHSVSVCLLHKKRSKRRRLNSRVYKINHILRIETPTNLQLLMH